MKYSVGLTISQELSQCYQKMRPFKRFNHAGACLFPVLSINVAIKHVDVEYLAAPLEKKTAVNHSTGAVQISLPQDISGYHAYAILMSGRGLQMISRIAYEAEHKAEGVCVPSPACFTGYLYDLWACLQDYLHADIEIEATELLLKELRLTVTSSTGRKITRFESMVAKPGVCLTLACSDTGALIDSEESLQDAISYRVRKAAVNSICINGLESRLQEIYSFCYSSEKTLGYERHVERPMPNSISYGSFAEAVRDVALSFELAEVGAHVFGDVGNKQLMTGDEAKVLLMGCLGTSKREPTEYPDEALKSTEGTESDGENLVNCEVNYSMQLKPCSCTIKDAITAPVIATMTVNQKSRPHYDKAGEEPRARVAKYYDAAICDQANLGPAVQARAGNNQLDLDLSFDDCGKQDSALAPGRRESRMKVASTQGLNRPAMRAYGDLYAKQKIHAQGDNRPHLLV